MKMIFVDKFLVKDVRIKFNLSRVCQKEYVDIVEILIELSTLEKIFIQRNFWCQK